MFRPVNTNVLQTLISSFIWIWLVIDNLISIYLFHVLYFHNILLLLFHHFLSFVFLFNWDFWQVLFMDFIHIFSHNLLFCVWLPISLLFVKMALLNFIEMALVEFILVWSTVEFIFYLFLTKISMKLCLTLINSCDILLLMLFLLLTPFFGMDRKF